MINLMTAAVVTWLGILAWQQVRRLAWQEAASAPRHALGAGLLYAIPLATLALAAAAWLGPSDSLKLFDTAAMIALGLLAGAMTLSITAVNLFLSNQLGDLLDGCQLPRVTLQIGGTAIAAATALAVTYIVPSAHPLGWIATGPRLAGGPVGAVVAVLGSLVVIVTLIGLAGAQHRSAGVRVAALASVPAILIMIAAPLTITTAAALPETPLRGASLGISGAVGMAVVAGIGPLLLTVPWSLFAYRPAPSAVTNAGLIDTDRDTGDGAANEAAAPTA